MNIKISKDGQWEYWEYEDWTIGLSKPHTPEGIKGNIVIPETIDGKELSSLGVACFKKCDKVKQVIVPKTVRQINSFCFVGCKRLTSVCLPESVVYVGSYVFYRCNSLRNVYTHGQTIEWGFVCFDGCPITEEDVGIGRW